jgi:outer membrane murein-binding lipoprotein Lpp
MKMGVRVVLAGVAMTVVCLPGCADLTPIQNQIKDLSNQVSHLSSEQASMRSTLDSTNRAVQGAEAAANRASSKADQALELAQANKASIDATNEKIDRMFRRHLSK